MRFTVIDAAQRSDEWRQARLGRLTASRAADVMAQIKSGEAAARRDYRLQLVCERLTGQSQDSGYVNADMQRGIDLEPAALAAYEAKTGTLVEKVGFCAMTDHQAGGSPDGVVGDFEGVVEVKCPKSATHLRYLRGGVLPSDYLAQVVCLLWVTGAQWVDFVSFDDRFPPDLQLFCIRTLRSEKAIKTFEAAALTFLSEVEEEYRAVLALRGAPVHA